MNGGRAAAFLDRDGILNARPAPHDCVRDVAELELLPGVGEAVRTLVDSGYEVVVVSNQRGVARGLVTLETLHAIEERLRREARRPIGFYYCTHDEHEGCDCRKPKPGLLLQAARELGLDLARSTMIGDSESDVGAGRAAGARTIRVIDHATATEADSCARDLRAAVGVLLATADRSEASAGRGRGLREAVR